MSRPVADQFLAASFAFAAATSCLVGCRAKSLAPYYCEGGVAANGRGLGGECLAVSDKVLDGDPRSVGTGHWVNGSASDRYSVRANGKEHYELFLDGALAGTIDLDDHWITVRLIGKPRALRLRDDVPGFLN